MGRHLKNPRAVAGFAGGGPGVSAVVEADLHKNHFIIVLANTDRGIAEDIAQSIFKAHRGKKYDEPKLPPANFYMTFIKRKEKII